MMGFVKSGQPTLEDAVIRTDSLANSPHSLKAQSMPGITYRNGWHTPYNQEDLYTPYFEKGNADGWGIVAYCKGYQTPLIVKSPYPAYSDPSYNWSINYLNLYQPQITLSHVRQGTGGNNNTQNSHPFVYKNWSFEHNGNLQGIFKEPFRSKVFGRYAKSLGDSPKGKTDSEAVFYYFLGRMQETYGTTDTNRAGLENTVKIFAKSLLEVVDKEKENHFKLYGSFNDLKGRMDLSPSCDVIASDGENLYAFKKGHSMYLGRYINALGERQYIIAQEKTNTMRTGKPIEWLEIPEEHVVVISKNPSGKYRPTMYPLTELVPEYNEISEKLSNK